MHVPTSHTEPLRRRRGSAALRRRAARWGPPVLRWYVAATFLGFHGTHKAEELLTGNAAFVATVAALGFPAPRVFAALAVAVQVGGAVCLLLGAATRPAALALAGTMAFAIVEKWPLGFLALEPALTYLMICMALVVTGAGAAAVDTRWEPRAHAWLDRRLRRASGRWTRLGVGVPIGLLLGRDLAGGDGSGPPARFEEAAGTRHAAAWRVAVDGLEPAIRSVHRPCSRRDRADTVAARPEYRAQRAEEDWRALRNDAARGDWWDPVKYVPLGRGGAVLALGGDVRLQHERFAWEEFGVEAVPRDAFVLHRYMLHADVRAADVRATPRAFVQLKSGLAFGREGAPRPPDVDSLDVHQAFVEFEGVWGGRPVAVRVGRQELYYGTARLVHYREGPNVRQSFDAVRVAVRRGPHACGASRPPWRADVLAAAPARTTAGAFDDGFNDDRALWGAYVSGVGIAGAAARALDLRLDAYYLTHRRRRARFHQNAPGPGLPELRHTLGTRVWGRAPVGRLAVDYNWEPMIQVGRLGSGAAAGRIMAWTIATETGISWPQARWSPRLSLRADMATGDRDPADPDLETFEPLYARGNYFGQISPVGPANFRDLQPRLELTVWPRAVVSAEWLFYWRASRRDGIYDPVGMPIREDRGTAARFVGHQPGVQLEWTVGGHATLAASAAAFLAGPYVRATPPAHARRNITYVSTTAAYRF